jgi:hypothetical protein
VLPSSKGIHKLCKVLFYLHHQKVEKGRRERGGRSCEKDRKLELTLIRDLLHYFSQKGIFPGSKGVHTLCEVLFYLFRDLHCRLLAHSAHILTSFQLFLQGFDCCYSILECFTLFHCRNTKLTGLQTIS